MKLDGAPPASIGKGSSAASTQANSIQHNQIIDEIQAMPHVGTRGILSRGRRRSDNSILEAFLNTDSLIDGDNEPHQLQHSPRKGQLSTEDEEHANDSSSATKSFAPMLLRPSSPIVNLKKSPAIGLEDANVSMNIDVNFDGYSNDKSAVIYSNRGASLQTDNDKTVPNSFATGNELETRFGSKEERVKSLPRVFLKKMLSFSQSSCSYKVPTAKLSTSRAVMALEVGIECSYTLEISLAGDSKKLFQPTDLLNIGKAMGKSLHEWMQPALAHLETKRQLEEQERLRQEQLDVYYTYNSRNKDRESRTASRSSSRPQSGSTTRSRLKSASGTRGGVLKGPSAVLMTGDLNDMLYGPNMNSFSEKPSLTLEGQKVHEAGNRRHERHHPMPATERPPKEVNTVKTTSTDVEKAQFAGQTQRKESSKPKDKDNAYQHQDKMLRPSLHVRHPVPEYIFDGTEKGDILVSPVNVEQQQQSGSRKAGGATVSTIDDDDDD